MLSGFMEQSLEADSLKCGYCPMKAGTSRGASSSGTPFINKTIFKTEEPNSWAKKNLEKASMSMMQKHGGPDWKRHKKIAHLREPYLSKGYMKGI